MTWQMADVLNTLAAAAPRQAEEAGSDWFTLGLLGLVVLFFLWLIVAAVKKTVGGKGSRYRELKEDEAEAARTARLWAEARRRTAEEVAEEDDEEDQGPDTSVQEELLDRARERREESGDRDQEQQRLRAEKLRLLSGEGEEEEDEDEEDKDEEGLFEGRAGEEAGEEAGEAGEGAREEAGGTPAQPPGPSPSKTPVPGPESSPSKIPVPLPGPGPAPSAEPRSLEDGLSATRSGFVSRLTGLFGKGELNTDQVEEIEEILFTADIGVRTAQKLLDFVQKEIGRKERGDPRLLLQALKDRIRGMLDLPAPPLEFEAHKPLVVLVVGVNGTGKTTTIGKLAQRHCREGKKVVLAAGDTFRAAAAEQLQVWGKRAGAQVIRGQDGGDPGSVVFDAIQAGRSQGADLVLADTAGRLHTKVNLVEELRKIHRVCGKAMEGAPHHVWLVLDATTGQNAINQAKEFHQALTLTGIVLTKLDGTAKGGVVIGIADTFGIPVRYIGIGEQAEDLRPFQAEAFVKALFL
jgi:fused signal recognition particle receptor